MKRILFTIAMIPAVASAQFYELSPADQALVNQALANHGIQPIQPLQPQQVYGIPVQPVLPVPNDRGPWGTGYSVVTTTRPTAQLYDSDVTGSETVQRVVPNGVLGQPIKGPNW